MSRRNDKIIIKAEKPCIIEVNGKKYRLKKDKGKRVDGILHLDKIIAVPFDEKKHDKRVNYILDKIIDSVDKKEIINQVLNRMTDNELIKIEKLLKKKAKVKKQLGCLGLKVGGKGGAYIDIM